MAHGGAVFLFDSHPHSGKTAAQLLPAFLKSLLIQVIDHGGFLSGFFPFFTGGFLVFDQQIAFGLDVSIRDVPKMISRSAHNEGGSDQQCHHKSHCDQEPFLLVGNTRHEIGKEILVWNGFYLVSSFFELSFVLFHIYP